MEEGRRNGKKSGREEHTLYVVEVVEFSLEQLLNDGHGGSHLDIVTSVCDLGGSIGSQELGNFSRDLGSWGHKLCNLLSS
jgi:hypothetical protein